MNEWACLLAAVVLLAWTVAIVWSRRTTGEAEAEPTSPPVFDGDESRLVACLFCGRSRVLEERFCECGQTRTVTAPPGAFYDHLAGVHASPARLNRVWGMSRRQRLALVREPDNEHDPNAIAVYDSEHKLLGYVRAATAPWLSRELDSGEKWQAHVAKVLGGQKKYAVMVMYLHKAGVGWPERDAWCTPDGEEAPEYYMTSRD